MLDAKGGGSDQQHQPGAATTDPKVFVATTLAALVLAGSAYIWKSGSISMLRSASRHTPLPSDDDKNRMGVPADSAVTSSRRNTPRKATLDPTEARPSESAAGETAHRRRGSQAQSERDVADSIEFQHDAGGSFGQRQQEAGGAATAGSLGRTSRPKERRRRGKDPTKELFKGGKLNKAINATGGSKGKTDGFSSVANSQHQTSPSRSRSRVSSESHGQSSTPRPQRRPSRSPSRNASTSSPPLSDNATISHFTSSSVQTSRPLHHSRSRSCSPSRPGVSSERVEPTPSSSQLDQTPTAVFSLDSLSSSIANLDTASTTSSTSSSIATEATASSSASQSTAASSLTSPTRETDRLNDSNGTPKAEVAKPEAAASSQGTTRPSGVVKDPWDWDGTGELNFPLANHSGPASGSTKPPRIQPKPTEASGPISSSEVLSGNAPLPYASVVSATGKPISASSHFGRPGNIEVSSSPRFSQRYVEDDEDRLDDAEVEAEEFSFPSLNNPDSSSASPYSTGANSASSSVSRPQSRASTSSGASSKGKPKHSRPISGLAPLSTRTGPTSTASGSGVTHRRVPTPKDGSTGRPGTPSSASAHPPPSPSSSFHTPGFLNSGSTVAVSAQTQLASLRGALEAARLREEKSKQDLEKVSREGDALRWENAAWRRREGELQSQIQQMAHQMQAYAAYVASMNHQASQPQPQHQPPTTAPAAPAPLTEPHANPPLDSASVEPENGDSATESAGPSNLLDVPNSDAADTSSVSGDLPPASNPDSDANPDASLDSGDTADANQPALASPTPPTQPQPRIPSGVHPLNILPFAPQPVHSPLASMFPVQPMSGQYPRPHSTFLHHHHPGSPNPQSPVGIQFPFQFPYLAHMNQHQPGAHSPQGPPPQQHHHHHPLHTPPFPLMPMGMQPLQSPGHPGMMMMHPGYGHSPSSSMGGGPSSSAFPQGGMGMGGASHPASSPSPASPLWMGTNGSAATSSKLGSGGIGNMSPPELGGSLSGPSSPLPGFFQPERGRMGRAGGRKRGAAPGLVLGCPGEQADGVVSPTGSGVISPGTVDEENSSVEQDLDASDGEGEDDEEDEDDGDFNVLLADAILKRPGSIRMGSSSSKRSSGNSSLTSKDKERVGPVGLAGSVSVNGVWPGVGSYGSLVNGHGSSASLSDEGHVVDEGQGDSSERQEEEEQREFTFPSLSDLGNVAREKRVGTPALAEAVPSSPPSNGASGLEGTIANLVLRNENEDSKSDQ